MSYNARHRSLVRVCVKVAAYGGVSCDPDSRDLVGKHQVELSVADRARQFVASHLPGIKATPSIVETCLQTVGQCLSYDSLYTLNLS